MKRIAAAAVCALALTACSGEVSIGSSNVSQSELEEQVAGAFTPDDPEAAVSAACDGEVEAERDATQTCVVSVGEDEADVRVVVTSVDGDDVNFDLVPFVPADAVGSAVEASLAEQNIVIDSIDCPEELAGEVGATLECAVTADGQEATAQVEVTEMDGLMTRFDYELTQ